VKIILYTDKTGKELNRLMRFNIIVIINLFILKFLDIEITRYALSTGRGIEINPIGVFIFRQNIFFIYFFSFLPFVILLVLVFYCYSLEELKTLKIAKICIIFLTVQNLFLVVNGVLVIGIW